MIKSPILYNVEDYKKWMFDSHFWTNKEYKPSRWDLPADHEFPLIAVGMVADYNGRWRANVEYVQLRDFQEATVYMVTQTEQIPDMFADSYQDKFFGIFTTERDAEQEIKYIEEEDTFLKHTIKPVKLNEVQK